MPQPPILYFPTFIVYLNDATKVAQLQALYPNGLTGYTPATAAAAFGAPIANTSAPKTLIDPAYLAPVQICDQSVDITLQPETTVQANCGPDGNLTYVFQWIGYFLLEGAATAAQPSTTVAVRRWIMGFELPPGGEGLSPADSSNLQDAISRDASRSVDGFGLAFRYAQNVGVVRRTTEYITPTTPNGSWERFYLRVRQLSAGTVNIWSTQGGGTGSTTDGLYLFVTATGQLQISNSSVFGGFSTLGTVATPLKLNTWVRVDIFVYYASGGSTPGYYELYLNGVLASSATVPYNNSGFGGLGRPQNHVSSDLGERLNAGNTLEIDFDDWHNAEPPPQSGIATWKTTYALDWNNGSHIRRVKATGVDAAGAWTGDYRMTLETPALGSTGRLTSTTGADQYSVKTDTAAQKTAGAAQNGAAAYVVGMYGHAGVGGGNGELGTTTTLTPITQGTADQFNSVLFGSLGTVQDVSAVKLAHQRGSVGGTAGLGLLGAAVEYLGVFGPEDVPVGDTTTRTFPPFIRHDAPYPDTEWTTSLTQPLAEVSIAGGTYTGNGTGQDIATLDPPHWIWIRPLSAPAGGARWVSTASVATVASGTGPKADGPVDPFGGQINSSSQNGFRVAGADSQVNANGVVYQYIAFCDPGMRYCCCGVSRHTSGLATAINALTLASFLGLAVFLKKVSLATAVALGTWYKGVGHAATNASALTQTSESGSICDLGVGTVTTYANVHDVDGTTDNAYAAFTTHDTAGSTDVTVQIVSYTGDGTGQRTINLTPVSGRWPMFALVAPHAGHAVVCRDPSHTGTTSANADTFADVADGIVGGGIDQISVHSDLNTNGVIYDVFVIPGCNGNTGWQNGTCVVASPLPSPGWPSPTVPPPGPPPPPPPPPGPPAPPPIPAGGCAAPIFAGGS